MQEVLYLNDDALNMTLEKKEPCKLPTIQQYDVEEYSKLFDEMGATFIPKEISSRTMAIDFCGKAEGDDPFYVVDLSSVVRQMMKWKKNLPRVKPFYAIKCNPSPAILKVIDSLGGGFDCASKQEIAAVLALGVDPQRIIFANPCKQVSHMKYARSGGVEMVTVDNEDELYKLRTYWPEARIVIRIKTDDSKSLCQFSSKFGASLRDCPRLIKVGRELGLNLIGVSFHVGSGCQCKSLYVKAVKSARQVFDMAEEYGYKFDFLDIGGGWPGNDDHTPSFEEIADVIRDPINELFPPHVEVIAEPGRYFVSASHTLITNIYARRENVKYMEEEKMGDENMMQDSQSMSNSTPDFLYYVNDGVYGSFNCLIFDHYVIKVNCLTSEDVKNKNYAQPQHKQVYNATVFGPTCDSMDKIAGEVMLPKLAVGDWLYFVDFGAYTIAAASAFNGFKTNSVHYIWRN